MPDRGPGTLLPPAAEGHAVRVELAIFDLGRATVHAEHDPVTRCLCDALDAAGVSVSPDALREVAGLHRLQALRVLLGPERAPRVGALHLDVTARLTAFYQSEPSLREAPGAGALFGALRRARVRVALASELPRALTDAVVDRLGWIRDGLLDATLAVDETRPAPQPEAVLELMRHARVTDARAVARVSADPLGLSQGAAARCGLVVAWARDEPDAAALAGARGARVARGAGEVASLLGVALATGS
jgi:beta-phosphoglucomutase-like phosphatase (HAD superfamily)